MIFIKKSQIVLDCFTNKEYIAKKFPMDFATNNYPEWWKKLPSSLTYKNNSFPSPTMKTCYGLIEYYKQSVAIPLWSDMAIHTKIGGEYNWQFTDETTKGIIHPLEQYDGYLNKDYFGHVKLVSPWICRTKESIQWIMTNPTFNMQDPTRIIIPHGIVNFKYQTNTNINMFLNLTKGDYIIPQGEVLACLTPLTEKNIIVKRHVVDELEYMKIKELCKPTSFINHFNKHKKLIDKNAKCPYSGGVK